MNHPPPHVWLAVSALAGILVLGCITEGDTTVNSTVATSPGITVSGTGRATGTPDVVELRMGTNVEGPTAAGARDAAAQAMQSVLDSMRANGVQDQNIQTTQFTVQPVYEQTPHGTKLRGYRVQNVVTAEVMPIDNVSGVIDSAAAAGGNATTIQSITFGIDDPTSLQTQAREQAMAQARARAEELARLAGLQLGEPVSINETYQQVTPPVITAPRTGPAIADTATPIQPGQLEVVVNVTVQYGLQ